jgi:hypothetical protein
LIGNGNTQLNTRHAAGFIDGSIGKGYRTQVRGIGNNRLTNMTSGGRISLMEVQERETELR